MAWRRVSRRTLRLRSPENDILSHLSEWNTKNEMINKINNLNARHCSYVRTRVCVCVYIYMCNINILSGVKRIGKTSSLMGGEYNRDQEEMGAKRQNMAMVERYDADDRNNKRDDRVCATTVSDRLARAPNWTDGLGVARWRGGGGGGYRVGGGCGYGVGTGGGGEQRRLYNYYDRYQTKLKPNVYNNTRRRLCVLYPHDRPTAPSVAVMSLLHQRFSEWIWLPNTVCSGYRLLRSA